MIYAMSDLHGCYDKYIKMLEEIRFSDSDILYVLGDVVDRGDGGIKILKDMMARKNVIAVRGNHDYSAARFLKLMRENPRNSKAVTETVCLWLMDGGVPTYKAFMKLSEDEQKRILSYLNSFWIYDEIEVSGRKYFLSHTVPEKARMQDFTKLLWQEFIVGEPEFEKQYFDDKRIIVGHTPTGLTDPEYRGRIYAENNFLAIDCGAAFGKPLGCVCLDTLEEFYANLKKGIGLCREQIARIF